MSKNQYPKRKKEFRFHKGELLSVKGESVKKWHPSYVFMEKGNMFIYVSLTHSSKVDDLLVIKLKRNPNPKDKTDSFVVLDIRQDTKDRFGKRLKNWKLEDEDELNILSFYNKKR